MRRKKQRLIILRKTIQSLYEVAEITKGKKNKSEIFYAIKHLNNTLKRKKK